MTPKKKEPAENLIGDLMDRIAGSEGQASSSGPVTVVLLSILVLVISILGIKLAWAKRKAAELAVQVRRAEEEKTRVAETIKLDGNEESRKISQKVVKSLNKEILILKAKIAKRQLEQEELAENLKPITSWDDIVVVDSRGDK